MALPSRLTSDRNDEDAGSSLSASANSRFALTLIGVGRILRVFVVIFSLRSRGHALRQARPHALAHSRFSISPQIGVLKANDVETPSISTWLPGTQTTCSWTTGGVGRIFDDDTRVVARLLARRTTRT